MPRDEIIVEEADVVTVATAEAEPAQPAPAPELIAEPVDTKDETRAARDLVPIGDRGMAPNTLAQAVDYAKTMANTAIGIPAHLRRQPGACLAIVDLSLRTGLSPFMIANHSFVPPRSDRLSFESQLVHALVDASGFLAKRLRVTYAGEGDARTCTVTGWLRGESEPHVWTSPPLGKRHPGYTQKNGRKYVSGSPLWDSKPDVQLAYDTIRDWARLYCPAALHGVAWRDEMDEPDAKAIDALRGEDTEALALTARLATADRSEGHKAGGTAAELAAIIPDKAVSLKDAAPPAAPAPAEGAPKRRLGRPKAAAAAAGATTSRPAPRAGAAKPARAPALAPEKPAPEKVKEAADRAAAVKKSTQEVGPKPGTLFPPEPTDAAGYAVYAAQWIDRAKDGDDAEARWEGEEELRRRIGVDAGMTKRLRGLIDAKFDDKD